MIIYSSTATLCGVSIYISKSDAYDVYDISDVYNAYHLCDAYYVYDVYVMSMISMTYCYLFQFT